MKTLFVCPEIRLDSDPSTIPFWAGILAAIVEQKEIPSDKKLSVMPESYVLGLLDCVGELKRITNEDISDTDDDQYTD
jgi:translin